MRLGLPSFSSLSKFCLEVLPAVVAMVVVGYLLSFAQADRGDGALPSEQVIQSTLASEIEEARTDRAMMRDVIKTRRLAEEQAAEQAREAKIANESAPAAATPVKEASPAVTTPLPPAKRVAAAPAAAPRAEAKIKPQPKPEPKSASAALPVPPPPVEPAPAVVQVQESRGPVMFVVDKAGELGRKAAATTGEAVAWVVSMPASLMGMKKVFSDSPPPQQTGHILKGS
jgi:hypothetical protein